MTVVSRDPTPLAFKIRNHAVVRRSRALFRDQSLVVLVSAGLLSVLVYWLLFVSPHRLSALYLRSLYDMRDLTRVDPLARWRLLVGFVIQGGLYWVGWRAARHATGRTAWTIVLSTTVASSLVLLLLYPYDAADVFDNIMHGRILGIYGANPFQHAPAEFNMDAFYRYTAWRHATSAYGPGWELLAGMTARLAGERVVPNVVAFKLLAGAFLLASIGVVAAVLRRAAPERALAGVVLLAWNPVILYETFGHGHNDMAMVFWILLAIWMLLRKRYISAILALVGGALFKFIPLLMLPAAVLIILRDLPHLRARVRFVAISVALGAILVVAAYAPFWYGTDTLDIDRRQALFTTSLPAVGYVLLAEQLGNAHAASVISRAAAVATAVFALVQGVAAWRNRTWQAFPQAAFFILMFYLLVTCLWFQSWYAVWPLGIAAVLPPGHAARLGALFGFAVLSKPVLFGPHLLWRRPLPPALWRELRLGPSVLALPWLYALFAIWHTRHGRVAGKNSTTAGGTSTDTLAVTTRPRHANALIVVAKEPAPGRTKTRLTPPLSPNEATALYECFLRDTLELVRGVPEVQPVVAFLPAEARAYFAHLAPDFELLEQQGQDLGTRLDHALTVYLSKGYQRVAIMNSDGPNLPASYLVKAFVALERETDVVLGPCDDGGYYLIGVKRPVPRLLREVRMSTPDVMADTMALAAEEGLAVELLPEWYDVDTADTLARIAEELADAPAEIAPHTRRFLDSHRELLEG
jgi:rSAM/selenodomain-associated transferase 1